MKALLSFVVLLGVFAVPSIEVNWSGTGGRGKTASVAIRAHEVEPDVVSCLDRSKQARIRFEARLCSRRAAWFDHCEAVRSELHTIEFDPISESYRVVTDRYGDVEDRVAVGVPLRTEAVRATLTVESLALSFLARDESGLIDDAGTYLQVRTIFSCKGAINRTVARLSQVVTLGIVNVIETTTDWSDFELYSSSREDGAR